jgi:predicted glycoside hydrolase/deacetylase ChbG (UPF0249 family)
LKQLIINADDFGLSAGVSRGILYAMRKGLVSSTSALVCEPAAVAWLVRHAKALAGRIGLHLQLTDGSPCAHSARLRSLVTEEGCFLRFPEGLGTLDLDEIRIEWRAQLDLFLRSGLTPSHIDTHHHVHGLPGVFEVYCEIAQRCRAPARTLNRRMTESLRSRGIACADYCETRWLGSDVTLESLVERLEVAFERCGGNGVVELMCHPGYTDRRLSTRSVYVSGRERELHILCSSRLGRRLNQLGIEIAGMAAVGNSFTAPD